MKKTTAWLLALALGLAPFGASAQQGFLNSGELIANSSASRGPAGPSTATAFLDRAFGSTSGQFLQRGASVWAAVAPGALTRTNDTNVTLTLGGTPTTALLAATSMTLGWTGTLGAARGGFGADVSGSSGVPLFAAGVPTFTGTSGTGNFARVAAPTITGASLTTVGTFGLLNSGFNTFIIAGGTNTANRNVTLNPVDGDRILTMSGNANFGAGFATLGTLQLPVVAQGDTWYGSATGIISALAKDTNATRYLSNQGGSNNPSWNQVNLTNGVVNKLPMGNIGATGTPSSSTFLRGDDTWSTPAGGGDVTGPASSTDNAAVRFDLTTGKLLQNSALIVADTTGALSRSGGGGIPIQGTNATGLAAAGDYGEYVESVVLTGSAISPTTGTVANVTSLSLPSAGDWDVSGMINYKGGSTTQVHFVFAGLSLTSVTLDTTPGRYTPAPVVGASTFFSGGNEFAVPIPPYRFSVSGATTVYLVTQHSYTVSTMSAYGIIRARRTR